MKTELGAKTPQRTRFAGTKMMLLLLFALGLALPSYAATLTVTKTDDDNSDGTLRKEIADAAPDDTIVFDASLDGQTIVLNGSELAITRNLTIDASALPNGIVISGDDKSRVLLVADQMVVTLKNLVITGGHSRDGLADSEPGLDGGGIRNDGNLTLQQCTVSGNRTGDGAASSLFGGSGGNGGGIFNNGDLTVRRSTISGNFTGKGGAYTGSNPVNAGGFGGAGGAIWNQGSSLTIRHSTISGNFTGDGGMATSSGSGGDGGIGGGIASLQVIALESSTILGNRTGDGGTSPSNNGGSGGNGGGIGTLAGNYGLTISDSIIAGNSVGIGEVGGADGVGLDLATDANTTPTSVNLIGDNTLVGGPSGVFSVGPLVGTGNNPLDPLLGPLADNGGPTFTHMPLPGSPAIDPVGGNTVPGNINEDQRGFVRIVGSSQDVGSVEAPDYAGIEAAAAAAEAQAAANAAARAGQIADLSKKLKKLKKKLKNAKRKGQAAKVKKFKKQIKSLTKQMRAL